MQALQVNRILSGEFGSNNVPITELITQPDCTLELILDHPDLHKELRKDGEAEIGAAGGLVARDALMNGLSSYEASLKIGRDGYLSPVVDWLVQPENLMKMVSYLVEEHPTMKKQIHDLNLPTQSLPHKSEDSAHPVECNDIYELIPKVTLTDFAPLSKDSYCVHIQKHYNDVNFEEENTWCRLSLDPPQETDTLPSNKEIYKYPYVIHDILTEASRRLLHAVSENDDILLKVFNFFSKRQPLNPVLLGYTSSMISTLMAKYQLDSFFFQHENDILEDLFFHMESRSVAEILKMLIFEERGKVNKPKETIHRLFECMDLSKWPCDILIGERQDNVFLIIRELILADKSCPLHNVYVHEILSSDIPDMLMESVFHWHKSTVTGAIGILVELLMYLDPHQEDEEACLVQQVDDLGNITHWRLNEDLERSDVLGVPMDHKYTFSDSDESDLDNSDYLLHDPPLYPVNPVYSSFLYEEDLTPYHAIWLAYGRYFSRKEKEESAAGPLPEDSTMPLNIGRFHNPVEQYPAPPRPYSSSGELFDKRLRKYTGRLITDLLEPLTAAAVAHRDRRRSKNPRGTVRNNRSRGAPVVDDDEDDVETDKTTQFGDYRDGSVSPNLECGPEKTTNAYGSIIYHEPAVESCELLPDNLHSALYPNPENPDDPIRDPYFNIDWLKSAFELPPVDPGHNALQHLIDVIPPEYTFSEYQNGRKVAFGLVQNSFQNGVRPVVGHRLLEVLHLFRAFIRVQKSKTFQLYIGKILQCVSSLLFAHKWNSILHISLGDIIIYAIQRGPTAWPDVVESFILESGFFNLSSKFMRRYIRFKKESQVELRRQRRLKMHSGALPIVLEILRIFQDLSKIEKVVYIMIRRICPDWDAFAKVLEEMNVDHAEWGVDQGAENA